MEISHNYFLVLPHGAVMDFGSPFEVAIVDRCGEICMTVLTLSSHLELLVFTLQTLSQVDGYSCRVGGCPDKAVICSYPVCTWPQHASIIETQGAVHLHRWSFSTLISQRSVSQSFPRIRKGVALLQVDLE